MSDNNLSPVVAAVVESHPDNAIEDLRLDHPFRTLTEYCDSQDMANMSKKVIKVDFFRTF